MFVIFPGPVRRLRLVNKAGQLPSEWDVIPQWLLKTTSRCQGIKHHDIGRVSQTFGLSRCILTAILVNMSHIKISVSINQVCSELFFSSDEVCKHLSYFVFLHSNCSEGTCDGCSFHFLWQSQHACPLCTKNHYKEIVSACIQGIQVVLHTEKQKTICRPIAHTSPMLCGNKYLEVLISTISGQITGNVWNYIPYLQIFYFM